MPSNQAALLDGVKTKNEQASPMSTYHISLFYELSNQIEQAAQAKDLDQIEKLDQQLVEVWRRIFVWRPRNPENIPILTEFLIDQLIANPGNETLNRQIHDKILMLVRLAYKLGREANQKRQTV